MENPNLDSECPVEYFTPQEWGRVFAWAWTDRDFYEFLRYRPTEALKAAAVKFNFPNPDGRLFKIPDPPQWLRRLFAELPKNYELGPVLNSLKTLKFRAMAEFLRKENLECLLTGLTPDEYDEGLAHLELLTDPGFPGDTEFLIRCTDFVIRLKALKELLEKVSDSIAEKLEGFGLNETFLNALKQVRAFVMILLFIDTLVDMSAIPKVETALKSENLLPAEGERYLVSSPNSIGAVNFRLGKDITDETLLALQTQFSFNFENIEEPSLDSGAALALGTLCSFMNRNGVPMPRYIGDNKFWKCTFFALWQNLKYETVRAAMNSNSGHVSVTAELTVKLKSMSPEDLDKSFREHFETHLPNAWEILRAFRPLFDRLGFTSPGIEFPTPFLIPDPPGDMSQEQLQSTFKGKSALLFYKASSSC